MVIAIPQEDEDSSMPQTLGEPQYQSESQSPGQNDPADMSRLGVQTPGKTAGRVQQWGEQSGDAAQQMHPDHMQVQRQGGSPQQGRKTVYITVSPQGGIRISSRNVQFSVRPDSGKAGD